VGSSKSTDEAVQHVMKVRFGDNYVTRDVSDVGSAKEAVSKGFSVIEGGSMSKEEWARVKAIKDADGSALLKTSAQVAPTNFDSTVPPSKIIPSNEWTDEMQYYARLVARIAPRLIDTLVQVQYIDDGDCHIQGCFQKGFKGNSTKRGYKRVLGQLTVNLAYHDASSSRDNYELLLHELAHNTLQSNDHLDKLFYDTVTELGAKLAILTLAEPKLFDSEAYSSDFTDVQPLWNAAPDVYPESYGGGGAAVHSAKASKAR